MKIIRDISSTKVFAILILASLILVNPFSTNKVSANDNWIEISDSTFTTNNQEIRSLNKYLDIVHFSTKSNLLPFEIFIYYENDIFPLTTDAPFYTDENALSIKNAVVIDGVFIVVVETTTND